MGGFNAFSQQTVADNGGVAWAKQVADSMDPGVIDSQIQGYQAAVTALTHVQTTLTNVKNNLASTWEGDAAEQAQQSFQQSINHAQNIHETITSEIIPALNTAQSAQATFKTTIAAVPDEKSVPSTNTVESGFDWLTGQATPTQQAQAHNIQARYHTAEALNTLSDKYEASSNLLEVAAARNTEGGFTPASNNSAFNLGSVSSSSGNGTASGYRQSVRSGGATTTSGYVSASHGNVSAGPSPQTTSSTTARPTTSNPAPGVITDPVTTLSGAGATETAPAANPVWTSTGSKTTGTGNSWYNSGGVITDLPAASGGKGSSGNALGEENLGEGRGTGSGSFGETSDGELNGGTGTGTRGGTSSNDGNSLIGEEENAGGAAAGEGEGGSETGMGGGRGMGGAAAGDEDLGSSRYSRGRYFGEPEADDGSPVASVRSVFEEATDAQGNKLDMLAPGRRGRTDEDEEDERGKRSSYTKEDEFWNSAQRIVPPVIQ